MAGSMRRSFRIALLGSIAVFPVALCAQNGYDPPAPIAPTSQAECSALNDVWENRIDELMQEFNNCVASTGRYCTNTRGAPDDCRTIVANTACGQVATYKRCVRLQEEWKCAIKRWEIAYGECMTKLRIYQAEQRQREQQQEWAAEQQRAQAEQQAQREQQARDRLASQQQATQSIANAVGNAINTLGNRRSAANETSSSEPVNTSSANGEPSWNTTASGSYARDFAPMVNSRPAAEAIAKQALISFVPDARVASETKNYVDGKLAPIAQMAGFVDLYKQLNSSDSSIQLQGGADAPKQTIGISWGPYSVNPVSAEVSRRSIDVITNVYGHALQDFDHAMQVSSANYSASTSATSTAYDRSTHVLNVPYIQASPTSVLRASDAMVMEQDDDAGTEAFLERLQAPQ